MKEFDLNVSVYLKKASDINLQGSHSLLLQYGQTAATSTQKTTPFKDSVVQFEFTYDETENVFTASHLGGMVKATVSLTEFPPRVKVNSDLSTPRN